MYRMEAADLKPSVDEAISKGLVADLRAQVRPLAAATGQRMHARLDPRCR